MGRVSLCLKCPLFASNLHTAVARGQVWLEAHHDTAGAQYDLGRVELELFMFFLQVGAGQKSTYSIFATAVLKLKITTKKREGGEHMVAILPPRTNTTHDARQQQL